MKAFIIGAAGFLGRVLCKRLQDSGWEVWACDVAAGAPFPADVRFQAFDVLRDEPAFVPGVDAVYYLAQSPFYREFPEKADHLFGVNTYGPVKAARAAAAAGARFFCYTSTGNVYRPSLEPLSEDCPVRRDEPYALSKLAAEEALRLFAPRMTVVAARLFGLFGPGQEKMLPAVLLRKVLAGEPVVLEPIAEETGETGGLTISFGYVGDTAGCLQRLAEMALDRTALPPVLNVAGPEPITVRRFAVTLGRLLGKEPMFTKARTVRTCNWIADIGLLSSLVNPSFLPFEEAMARSLA